ncbi:MAG: rhomboid family intramembrane serine protease [Bacteroidia bacterium]
MVKKIATVLFIAISTIVFLIMVFSGVNFLNPGVHDLIRYGANFNALVYQGEYFRLITSQFVHVGIIHLVVNMFALYSLGSVLEEQLGKFRFVSVYILSGIAGGLLSASWHSFIVSTGASGAIMGLAGADLALILLHPATAAGRTRIFIRAFSVVLINLIIGFSFPFIDNAAHIGGLLFGFFYIFISYSVSSFENKTNILKEVMLAFFSVFLLCLGAYNLPAASYNYYVAFNRFINYESIATKQSEGKGYIETEKYIQQLKEIKAIWLECKLMLDTLPDLPEDLDYDTRLLKKYSYYKMKALDQYIKAISEEEFQLLDSMEITNTLLAMLPKPKHGIAPEPEKKDTDSEKSTLRNVKIFYDQNWKVTDSIHAKYFREAQVDSLNRVNGFVYDYYRNGQIQMKGYYLNDLKNDIFRYYYPNGNYESMGKYTFDEPTGKWKNYYMNGALKEELLYTDERVLLKNFWDSLRIRLVYDGTGIYITYNPDGSPRDSGNYLDGLKNGIWQGNYSIDKRYYIEKYFNGRLVTGASWSPENEIFQYTKNYVAPEPVGGVKNYKEYLEKNLVYPENAKANRIEGIILTDVTIDSTGKKINIENVNKLGFGCDEEAKRLIKEGSDFSPAREKGQIIKAVKRIEVKFDLNKER